MANGLAPVNPGDLITSDLMNGILAKIRDMDTRIGKLEEGGASAVGAIISGFDPPSQVEVGKPLTVFGKFDFPPSFNTVTIDGKQITDYRAGSNDSQLIFLVPTSIGIPSSVGSKSVKILVHTSKGDDERSYLLLSSTQSSVPNPSINSILNLEDTIGDPTTLQTGKKAKITGVNFAGDPSANIVKFKIQRGATTVTYPKDVNSPLAIDPANTTTAQIVVTVPTITEIAPGSTSPVVVEVGVGTAVPDSKTVNVIRL